MVQIPLKIVPTQPPNWGTASRDLIVNDNGTESKAFNLFPHVDNLHVITAETTTDVLVERYWIHLFKPIPYRTVQRCRHTC